MQSRKPIICRNVSTRDLELFQLSHGYGQDVNVSLYKDIISIINGTLSLDKKGY